MLKNILELKGVVQLNKKEQGKISGGFGQFCRIFCNSGVSVGGAPDASASTQARACANQGGPTGRYICSGPIQ
ncbi:hypothetical protein [Spongiimicrobium salis]|uniref:hypothetical protein n=1 Tax=Spongiimicrobium salis TaxID=1667022 RepID=UPI00374CB44B